MSVHKNCPEDRAAIAALEHRLARLEYGENPVYDWHRFRRTPAGVYGRRGEPRGGRFASIHGGSPARVVQAREKVRNPLSNKQKRALRKGQLAIKRASAATRRKWAIKAAKTRCEKKLALLSAAPAQAASYSYSVPPPQALEESMKSYEMAHNPELLIVGNPKKRRLRLRVRHKRRSRKGGPKRIKYGKKMYYYIQLVSKFGKGRARKIWGRKSRRSCIAKCRRRSSGRRRALPAPKSSWMKLVKRFGVMGAVKHRRRRSRR